MDNGCGGEQQHYNNNNERGQNGNNINFLWDFREVGTCRFDWSNPLNDDTRTTTTASTAAAHAFMFSHTGDNAHHQSQHPTLYSAVGGGGGGGGGGSHVHPDPHLTCLKLGKRHYFEDTSVSGGGLGGGPHVSGFPIGKRGRSFIGVGGSSSSSSLLGSSTVPRCQVEGCHVALLNAKDYHRRHKVCEMHSKAPKVVVLGIEQRFCQQCSRFHVVSEFDDSKRSCRRRLAGHNERRRKSSNDSLSRNLSQDSRSMGERYPCISSPAGGALSLLSSKTISWVSPSDLSSRSSAALRELIAENRASILARQLFYDQGWPHHPIDEMGSSQSAGFISHLTHQHQMFPDPSNCDRFHESGAQVTVDLMQEPSSAFLTGKSKSKEEEEDCCELWRSLEGTYVV